MKLSKERISHMAASLVARLQSEGYLEVQGRVDVDGYVSHIQRQSK